VCGGQGIIEGKCDCEGINELDCAGVCGGDKLLDNCEVCDADTSNDCTADCNGDYGGLAYTDECDDCVGGNTALSACVQDDCGIWGGDNSPNTGTCDCAGTPNGTATIDDCGVCGGDNAPNTGTCDCNAIPNGIAYIDPHSGDDDCPNNCVGGTTGLNACVPDCAGDWNGTMVDADYDGFCDDWEGLIVTDIDENTYETVQIGYQLWMKENLKVTSYNNGDEIPIIYDDTNWLTVDSGAYTVYDNRCYFATYYLFPNGTCTQQDPYSMCPGLEEDICNSTQESIFLDLYGNLYNWYVIYDNRGICPEGWHIPTFSDWHTLIEFLGGEEIAGGKMKTTGTISEWNSDVITSGLWRSPNEGADNFSGFSALPAGIRNGHTSAAFWYVGKHTRFWIDTNFEPAFNYELSIDSYSSKVMMTGHSKNYGHSIRCLKD